MLTANLNRTDTDSVFAVPPSFSNRRVTVLGASGFLGARAVTMLAEAGAEVTALTRGAVTPRVPRNVRVILGDIRRASDLAAAVSDADVIFMLAGRSGAASSFADPHADLETNAAGLLALLGVVSGASRPPKILFPGSRLEYGAPGATPVSEAAPLRPNSPYALHKVLCESYLALYRERFGIRYAVARMTNPYGPALACAWRGYNVITSFVARALAGDSITVYGDGAQLRDYIYVDDAVRALLVLAASDDDAAIANVGSGEGIAMVAAAKTIVELCGSGSVTHVPWPLDAQHVETGDFVADISRMRALGWQPEVPFATGIRRTVKALRARAAV